MHVLIAKLAPFYQEAFDGHVLTSGKGNGISCRRRNHPQRSSSKKLHVSLPDTIWSYCFNCIYVLPSCKFMLTKFVVTDRIGMDLVIKVADFGLSVSSGNKDYYRVTSDMGIRLPLKWMAPESLTDYIFSEMSDVVSALVKQ